MAAPLPGDKRAGFTGLIVGGIAIFLILWGITHLTNQKFAGHAEGAEGGARTEQQGGQGH